VIYIEVLEPFFITIGVKSEMLTAYYSEIENQTQRVPQAIELVLMAFINLEMIDWIKLVPMAEFAYNNSRTILTGHALFYAYYGFHPNCGTSQPRTETLSLSSKAYGYWMTANHDNSCDTLEKPDEIMKMYVP
jgi:hypothetical protein